MAVSTQLPIVHCHRHTEMQLYNRVFAGLGNMNCMFYCTTAPGVRKLCRLWKGVEMYRLAEDGTATSVRPSTGEGDIEPEMTERSLCVAWLGETPWATDAQIQKIRAWVEATYRAETGQASICVVQ